MPRRGAEFLVGSSRSVILPRLGVDPADVLLREVGEVEVVLRVRDDVVDVVVLARLGVLERRDGLDRRRSRDRGGGPPRSRCSASIPCRRPRTDFGAHHVDLRHVLVHVGRQAEGRDLLGLGIELADRALVHHAEPEVAVLVGAQAEAALRPALLELGQRELGDLAGLGIEPADVLLAEVRVVPAMPSLPTITSCGSIVARGRSYSVMITSVARPFGRGSVLSG